MCNPMAFMIVSTIASTAMQAYGQVQQGKNAQEQANYQAKLSERDAQAAEARARDVEYRGLLERQDLALNAENLRAEGQVGYASGNVQLGSGSVVDWETDLAERKAGDDRTSKYNEKVGVWGEKMNASDARSSAMLSRAGGSNAASVGRTGAVGSMLAGASKVGESYYKYKYA